MGTVEEMRDRDVQKDDTEGQVSITSQERGGRSGYSDHLSLFQMSLK